MEFGIKDMFYKAASQDRVRIQVLLEIAGVALTILARLHGGIQK
jgi:hypothetical protein